MILFVRQCKCKYFSVSDKKNVKYFLLYQFKEWEELKK